MRYDYLICTTLILVSSDTYALRPSVDKLLTKLSSWNPVDWARLSRNRLDAVKSTHPLRHPSWKIKIEAKSVGLPNNLVVTFHKDGRITTSNPDIAGQWQYGPYGIIFSLSSAKGLLYRFSAEICWNNYGDSAFFRKGVVYSDRTGLYKYLFRPIHGKFTGRSIRPSKT